MGIFSFIIVLSILVFIHELGHFLVARFFGVKVNNFSIGFGPKLVSTYWRGTTWSISAIPLGGYVQMKGQEDLDPLKTSQDKDSYSILSPYKKIAILFAGPFANFVLAYVLYFCVGLMPHNEFSTKVGNIAQDMPAFQSGIQQGDVIVRINETDIKLWDDLKNIIAENDGALKIFVERDGSIRSFLITPEVAKTKNIFGEEIERKMIGVAPGGIVQISYSFMDSFVYAFHKTMEAGTLIFQSLQKLLQGIVPASEVGGVISIGKVISDASESGIVAIFIIAALISVNLGVLNLLPIPALDGGHIMFNFYEILTKRKPSKKVLINLTILGWIILIGIMSLGLYNDINRYF